MNRNRLLALRRLAWAGLSANAGAFWLVLTNSDFAYADDCLAYASKVSNLVALPRGVLEDCMRTGSVQAIITAIVSLIGGGATAIAIREALKAGLKQTPEAPGPAIPEREGPPKDNPFDPTGQERRDKWAKEGLVWDPRELGWRRPKPEEIPPPENPPEEAPPYQRQNPRNKTPPECLNLYDEYVRAEADLLRMEPEMQALADSLKVAQEWLQTKLTIFTVQFGADMTDFFQLGVAGARLAGPLSAAIGRAGSLAEMFRAVTQKAASLARAAGELAAEVAEFGAKAVKLRSAAEIATETLKFLAKQADELTEAALAIDKRVASNRQLVRVAQDIETLVEKRASMAGKLLAAEQKLRSAEAVWRRRAQLQRWAEGERVSIGAEQARLAVNAQAELDAVNAELRELSAKIAQSAEVERAAVRTSKATTTCHRLQAEIRELEARAEELTGRIERLNILKERKQAFLAAETARDAAAEVVDEIDSEIRALKNEIDEALDSPEMRRLQDADSAAFKEFDDARSAWKQTEAEYGRALSESGRVNNEIEAALEARNGQPPITIEERAALTAATKAENDANRQMRIAKTYKEQCERVFDEAVQKIEAKKAADAAFVKDFENQITAKNALKQDKSRELQSAAEECQRAEKALQSYSHPGMDPKAIPEMQRELDGIPAKVEATQHELTAANREFDEAHNIDQNVRTQLEGTEREALEARKASTEAKMKRANRSWQEVAAEKDPGNLARWRQEVEGTDPFNDAPKELEPLQKEVLDLRKEEASIENEINAKRDQSGGKTPESLMSEIDQDHQLLDQTRKKAAAANEQAATKKADADRATNDARAADLDHTAKQDELKKIQAQQADADAEVTRLSTLGPEAGSGLTQVGGGPLEPGKPGDAIDDLARRSHVLSQQWKPGMATSIEDGVKSVAQWAGKKWEHYFNGQSPDDVAQGLKKSRDTVIRLKQELETARNTCDTLRAAVKDIKPRLDQCITQHTFWSGPSASGD